MRTTILALLLIATFAPGVALAKGKERVFNAPPDRVFAAAVKAARENFSISYVDDKSMTLAFHTGISLTSNGFDCNASVLPMPEGSRLVVNPQKKGQLFAWGAGDRVADKFFDAVKRNLTAEQ